MRALIVEVLLLPLLMILLMHQVEAQEIADSRLLGANDSFIQNVNGKASVKKKWRDIVKPREFLSDDVSIKFGARIDMVGGLYGDLYHRTKIEQDHRENHFRATVGWQGDVFNDSYYWDLNLSYRNQYDDDNTSELLQLSSSISDSYTWRRMTFKPSLGVSHGWLIGSTDGRYSADSYVWAAIGHVWHISSRISLEHQLKTSYSLRSGELSNTYTFKAGVSITDWLTFIPLEVSTDDPTLRSGGEEGKHEARAGFDISF